MDVKADHRAAGLSIHLNFLDVRAWTVKIAVGFALRRRRAAVACLTKIGAGLNGLFRQLRLTGTGPCGRTRVSAGRFATTSATSRSRSAHPDRSRSPQSFWFPRAHHPTSDAAKYCRHRSPCR